MIVSGFGGNVGCPEGVLAARALTEVSSAIFATGQLCLRVLRLDPQPQTLSPTPA